MATSGNILGTLHDSYGQEVRIGRQIDTWALQHKPPVLRALGSAGANLFRPAYPWGGVPTYQLKASPETATDTNSSAGPEKVVSMFSLRDSDAKALGLGPFDKRHDDRVEVAIQEHAARMQQLATKNGFAVPVLYDVAVVPEADMPKGEKLVQLTLDNVDGRPVFANRTFGERLRSRSRGAASGGVIVDTLSVLSERNSHGDQIPEMSHSLGSWVVGQTAHETPETGLVLAHPAYFLPMTDNGSAGYLDSRIFLARQLVDNTIAQSPVLAA